MPFWKKRDQRRASEAQYEQTRSVPQWAEPTYSHPKAYQYSSPPPNQQWIPNQHPGQHQGQYYRGQQHPGQQQGQYPGPGAQDSPPPYNQVPSTQQQSPPEPAQSSTSPPVPAAPPLPPSDPRYGSLGCPGFNNDIGRESYSTGANGNFDVCISCYDTHVAKTCFANRFVRTPNLATNHFCDFSMPVMREVWNQCVTNAERGQDPQHQDAWYAYFHRTIAPISIEVTTAVGRIDTLKKEIPALQGNVGTYQQMGATSILPYFQRMVNDKTAEHDQLVRHLSNVVVNPHAGQQLSRNNYTQLYGAVPQFASPYSSFSSPSPLSSPSPFNSPSSFSPTSSPSPFMSGLSGLQNNANQFQDPNQSGNTSNLFAQSLGLLGTFTSAFTGVNPFPTC